MTGALIQQNLGSAFVTLTSHMNPPICWTATRMLIVHKDIKKELVQ